MPQHGGPKPTSRLVWSMSNTAPHTINAVWIGSGGHYTLHWGDGTSQHLPWWSKPVKHTYPDWGRYRLLGITDGTGVEKSTWVELSDPTPPPPPGPAPKFVLHRLHGTYDLLWIRCLLAPDQGDGFDHRRAAHDIDWGDGTVEHVPAATPHVDHQYRVPGNIQYWEHGRPFPLVTVTDSQSGEHASKPASELRSPLVDFNRPHSSAGGDPRQWETWVSTLPTQGPGTSYQFWHAGELLRTDAPEYPKATYFYWTENYPDSADGWTSGTLVNPDGEPISNGVLLSGRNLARNVAAYDWDWTGDPCLIRVTPFAYGTGRWWEHKVDWGDSSAETIEAPEPEPDTQAGEPVIGGANPRASHWFDTDTPRTITVWSRLRNHDPEWGPSSTVRIGPCRIAAPTVDPNDPAVVRVDFEVQHPAHPVRVDWGDGTPVTVQHPAGDTQGRNGRLTHRYDRGGTFWITVYAPMQRPVGLPPVTVKRTKSLGFTAWFGDVTEWDGGYSGKFHITNNTTTAQTWAIEFHLDSPAVLREVWPGSKAHYADLGDGRWRIQSSSPIPAGGTADVGARIEPAGEPDKWPQGITASPWDPGSEHN